MKKEILTRIIFTFCFGLMLNAASAQIIDNAIDDIGDIAFVAYTTNQLNGMAGFAFVLLDNCPANTSIGFTDDEWTGSSFAPVNEGELIWTSPNQTIAKGTVIKIAGPITAGPNSNVTWTNSNCTAHIGSISASGQFTTTSGDQLFAMTGNRTTPGTFLAFVGTSITASGLVMDGTQLGTGSAPNIVLNTKAVLTTQGNKYTGSTLCSGTVIACNTMVNTTASWGAIGALVSVSAFYAAIPDNFTGSVLPVELTSFIATTEGPKNNLIWATASETNNKGFDIERSYDGTNFSTIGTVKAQGKAGTYTFIDAQPFNGINYYRLKQMDFDGKETLSKVVSVTTKGKGTSKIKIFPTNTEGVVLITNYELGITTVAVFNQLGQLVLTNNGVNRLDLSAMPSGLYLVQVQAGGETVTEKVFKR